MLEQRHTHEDLLFQISNATSRIENEVINMRRDLTEIAVRFEKLEEKVAQNRAELDEQRGFKRGMAWIVAIAASLAGLLGSLTTYLWQK